MKIKIKYLIEHMVQTLLQLFRVFPLKNQVCFSSFSGRQYSDSPRRISELLQNQHPEIRQVWAFEKPEDFAFLAQRNITLVKYKSMKYLYYVMTSKVYVDNVEFWSALKFRKEQMVVETWHGGGAYKKVGSDRIDVGSLEQQHAVEKMNKITLFLSSSKAFTEYVIRGAYQYHGEVLSVGLPRNDELIAPNPEVCSQVRKRLGLENGEQLVLYAPTFRNSLSTDIYNIDLERLHDALTARFGGRWTVAVRMHYYIADRLVGGDTAIRIIDTTDYPDMQELLCTADVLVTDYSSSMWDFSLLKRPCFLYVPDVNEYQGERDFYTPIESWPFPKGATNDALAQAIASFDADAYDAAVEHHHNALGSCETGTATRATVDRIVKYTVGG